MRAITLAKEHGTYLDMDIYDDECIQAAGKTGSIPADCFWSTIAIWSEISAAEFYQRRRFGRAVKMTFGTDAGVCPCLMLQRISSRSW